MARRADHHRLDLEARRLELERRRLELERLRDRNRVLRARDWIATGHRAVGLAVVVAAAVVTLAR